MDNLRGAGWMTLAMLCFAIADACIKLLAGALPTWQIIAILALGGGLSTSAVSLLRGEPVVTRDALTPAILARNLGEIIGTLGFVTALALTPISTASAILQATPLAVTLGAALFLRESVGWRRWAAILVGFAGVILIIRPGMDGFDANALFALVGVAGLSLRDLATRNVPKSVSSGQLSTLAFLALLPASGILAAFSGSPPAMPQGIAWLFIAGIVSMIVIAYFAIVSAMRVGDVSYVTPFRYSRILFALVIGVTVFDETPDAVMLVGAALIVGSGLFTIWRERKHRTAT
jgi:drug/metabolite transporter (DMT)-like permease